MTRQGKAFVAFLFLENINNKKEVHSGDSGARKKDVIHPAL
jgi:hypothetical protein